MLLWILHISPTRDRAPPPDPCPGEAGSPQEGVADVGNNPVYGFNSP